MPAYVRRHQADWNSLPPTRRAAGRRKRPQPDDWRYLNMLVMLAGYRRETGDPQAAVCLYQKILIVEPRFRWVREELYPAAVAELHAQPAGTHRSF